MMTSDLLSINQFSSNTYILQKNLNINWQRKVIMFNLFISHLTLHAALTSPFLPDQWSPAWLASALLAHPGRTELMTICDSGSGWTGAKHQAACQHRPQGQGDIRPGDKAGPGAPTMERENTVHQASSFSKQIGTDMPHGHQLGTYCTLADFFRMIHIYLSKIVLLIFLLNLELKNAFLTINPVRQRFFHHLQIPILFAHFLFIPLCPWIFVSPR